MNSRLLILTSRKNYVWASMEEIISWIEKSWVEWAIQRQIPCKIINVDDSAFSGFIKEALASDLIVITCFNTSITRFLYPLRRKLSINTPWIFYLHGLASFGTWPLFKWKIGQQLNSQDVFIGSCERDKKQFELIFKNLDCKVIPFGLNQEASLSSNKPGQKRKFAYIGRMSSQKNLHSLILAFSILKNSCGDFAWEIHFFGQEDNYGSPLMGRRETGYQKYLEELCQKLEVDKQVHFHGFVQREKIEALMENEPWIFISPGLHSDENFGMAAFRCLVNGHKAILSDWGGHHDFIKEFGDSITLLPVYKSPIGPFIDITEMVTALKTLKLNSIKKDTQGNYPPYYSRVRIQSEFDELYKKALSGGSTEAVKTSQLLDEILLRREDFLRQNPSGGGAQIFNDYQDSLKDPFFDAYGQIKYKFPGRKTNLQLCPWVEENDSFYQINDPHRGQFSLSKSHYKLEDLLALGLAWSLGNS